MRKRGIKRILVIRLAKIGSVLLTTPLLRQLRRNFPKAHITYVVGKIAAGILEGNPHISEILISDRNIFAKVMKKEPYDLAIDLMGVPATAQLCMLSGAPYRVGIHGRKIKNYNIILGPPKKNVGAVDSFGDVLDAMGLKHGPLKRPEIYLSRKEKNAAGQRVKRGSRRIIGIQPGTQTRKEIWPGRNFACLADRLVNHWGAQVVILQGPGEKKFAHRMRRAMSRKARLLPAMGLRKYLAHLSQFNTFISNEGGPLHMAMALRVPTMGILGRENGRYWYGYALKDKKFILIRSRDIAIDTAVREIGNWIAHP